MMAVGYGYRRATTVDWTFIGVTLGGAFLGGILGFFMSFLGLIIGLLGLIALKFINVTGNMQVFLISLFATMFAGGLASFFAGSAASLSAEDLSKSESAFAQMYAIPQKLNEWVYDKLGIKKAEITSPEQVPEEVQEEIVAEALATTTAAGVPTTGATWSF